MKPFLTKILAFDLYSTGKAKAETFLRKILDSKTKGVFSDTSWKPISEIRKELEANDIDFSFIKNDYYHDKEGNPAGKSFDAIIYCKDKGGWHLRLNASFGPSKVGSTDKYDLIYTLSWDGKLRQDKEVNAGDLVSLKPYLKQKKADEKQEREKSLQPDWTKAKMRVYESSAYAGGYELEVRLPVPADFIKDKKKDNRGEFVKQLHNFINEKTGRWLGAPSLGGLDARAKNGMIDLRAVWHFDDAYLAYALGLDLSEWRGSNDVVDKNQIEHRMNLAEKAYKEMSSFKELAQKKLKLRSQNDDERNKIWKEEFMPEFSKLTDKWKERGLAYHALVSSPGKKRAFGKAIEAHYKIESLTKDEKIEQAVKSIMEDPNFTKALHEFIAAANAGILVGHKQNKPEMVKFNALSLAFFQALHKKDLGAAISAAQSLVKAGHGEAFGL